MLNNLRNRHFLLWDAVLLTTAPFMAYAIRFEGLGWSAVVPLADVVTEGSAEKTEGFSRKAAEWLERLGETL